MLPLTLERADVTPVAPGDDERIVLGGAAQQQVKHRARQLTDVLQQKSPSQYYGKQVDPETARRVMTQAGRFIQWVRESLPQPESERPRNNE